MRIRRFLLPALLISAAGAFLLLAAQPRGRQERDEIPAASSPPAVMESTQTLFPSFSANAVTAVSIVTPQTAFDLRREDGRLVSVNGRRGDPDVFMTLLEQIAAISFTPTDPFAGQSTPLLTLVVRQRDAEHSAVFYSDESKGDLTRIVIGHGGTSAYGTTDGWRIGTLMLACEGVRVQDESGNEIPFK